MSIRLPDFYYTDKMLDGTNKQLYPKQLGLFFNQGEDCRFFTYLNMYGCPFDLDKWDITLFVKKNDWAKSLMWRGTLNNGIFPVANTPGYFEVWMPSLVTQYLKPGSYHFGFQAKEKIGAGNSTWDKVVSLREEMIQILRSTDMPNPVLPDQSEIITKYIPETGLWEYGNDITELTVPTNVPVLVGDGAGNNVISLVPYIPAGSAPVQD